MLGNKSASYREQITPPYQGRRQRGGQGDMSLSETGALEKFSCEQYGICGI